MNNTPPIPVSQKPLQWIASLRQLAFPPEFRITSDLIEENKQNWEHEIEKMRLMIENSTKKLEEQPKNDGEQQDILKLLAQSATGIWRAAQKVESITEDSMESHRKRIYRPLESTLMKIEQSGIRIADQTGQPYIVGMVEKVLAFQPTGELERDTIIETIKPTIYYHDELIQIGEIIVGTTSDSDS